MIRPIPPSITSRHWTEAIHDLPLDCRQVWKNSLFYRTRRGARVGDMHMSLIYTCELCRVSPFDYLVALHQHADQVTDAPAT